MAELEDRLRLECDLAIRSFEGSIEDFEVHLAVKVDEIARLMNAKSKLAPSNSDRKKISSICELYKLKTLQEFLAIRNSTSCCIIAICAAGPPKSGKTEFEE